MCLREDNVFLPRSLACEIRSLNEWNHALPNLHLAHILADLPHNNNNKNNKKSDSKGFLFFYFKYEMNNKTYTPLLSEKKRQEFSGDIRTHNWLQDLLAQNIPIISQM